jgi:hypothetical protein
VEIIIFTAFCFNFILTESLYVCMGFALYINSRVEIEGWDLQLLFQRFAGSGEPEGAKKASPPRGRGGRKITGDGTIPLLGLCFLLFLAPGIYANSPQDEKGRTEVSGESPEENQKKENEGENIEPIVFFPPDFPSPQEASLDNLEEILASADFGSEKEGWTIRRKKSRNPEKSNREPNIDIIPWLKRIKEVFAFILRLILILAAAAFTGFALYRLWKSRRKGNGLYWDKGKSYIHPFLSPESPEALFARAEDFFARGSLREAWAACLAGSIGACMRFRSLSFPPDATEYGCLELVRRVLPAEAKGFGELVRHWIFLAYGDHLPGEGAFERDLVYGRSLLAQLPGESPGGQPDQAADGQASKETSGEA